MMPAFTRKADGALLVTFARDGEPDEAQLAPTPHRALGAALIMLAHREALYAGDRLTVKDADDGVDLTREGIS
jgi:hypothetical protein